MPERPLRPRDDGPLDRVHASEAREGLSEEEPPEDPDLIEGVTRAADRLPKKARRR